MQPITRGCLRNLHTPNCSIAVHIYCRSGADSKLCLKLSHLYPKPIPRDLYHRLKRAPPQANSRQCSYKAFIADNASFGRFPIFHYDDKRNQTSIREIRKFQLFTLLVKDEMVWQADVFEMRANGAVVAIGDR